MAELVCLLVFLAPFLGCAEAICWRGGAWDETGAPKGKLLSDNEGWWGRSIYTGVTYSYATAPDNPRDIFKGDAALFGRRLLDGDAPTGWHRPVGMTKKRPLVVTFDFKRPCVFTEVDLLSLKSPDASARVEVSPDGTNWTVFASAACTAARTRLRPPEAGRGRYLRLAYRSASSSSTYLDEVLVWGDGTVSSEYPENIVPIPRGRALQMSARRDGGIAIVPLSDPTASSTIKIGMPPLSLRRSDQPVAPLVMARNETEVRYFAVVNETPRTLHVPFAPPDLGASVTAELRIGGLVRTQPPKYKLTEKQRFDLLLTGKEPEEAFDPEKMDVLPFFGTGQIPPENFARKYLANPQQVTGFPGAVEIAPGEGAVVMLRVTTQAAAPSVRRGSLTAGTGSCELELRVLDALLPDAAPWIFVWSPFTHQFPFESVTRFQNDVAPIRDLGATMFSRFPEKGSKVALAAKNRGAAALYYRVSGVGPRVMGKTYAGKAKMLDEMDRAEIRARVAQVRAEAAACGVRPEQVVLEISDEPGVRNAALFGETCRVLREAAPEMNIYMNPSFWAKTRFAPTDEIIAALGGYYGDCVDVSVPYRSLVEDAKGRAALWTTPRRVNAQYAHPAHRAGRSIAWSSFRYGMTGFAYWAYYTPRGNPWDIRTWRYWAYECQLAFPLENGVALTPVYEEMREAKEDWLMLSLLRQTGRTELLNDVLEIFAKSFAPAQMDTARPYTCDFAALRLKILESFERPPSL